MLGMCMCRAFCVVFFFWTWIVDFCFIFHELHFWCYLKCHVLHDVKNMTPIYYLRWLDTKVNLSHFHTLQMLDHENYIPYVWIRSYYLFTTSHILYLTHLYCQIYCFYKRLLHFMLYNPSSPLWLEENMFDSMPHVIDCFHMCKMFWFSFIPKLQ